MSYTLAYQGAEIDDILGRAAPGGALDVALATKQDALTFDAVPTEGSTNPAESGGIYDAIQAGGAAALAAFATDTVSGDVVSFPDGADGIPVKSFTGSILPAQSGSGDPAPDNIRPISGWTGANITRCGKNQYDVHNDIAQAGFIKPGGTFDPNNGWRITRYIPLMPSATYTASGLAAAANQQCIALYDASQTLTRTIAITANTPITFTTTASEVFVRLSVRVTAGEYLTAQLELGATATAYEPYTADTILLDFGQTVYAGTLTALGGGLWSVQPTHVAVDMGSATWTYISGRFRTAVDAADITTRTMKIYCSCYQCIDDGRALANVPDYSIYNGGGTTIYVHDSRYTTAADLAAALSGQYMVYPMGTLPDPITITASDLQTLLGANTIWTDCGSVTSLEYRADTKLYIDKRLG